MTLADGSRLKIIALLLVGAGAVNPGLYAQTATSAISGTVYDPSGAVVPDANVSAIHEATGVSYHQQTTSAGLYSFSSVPAGKYSITVDRDGFQTITSTGNLLQVGSPITVDITLRVGQANDKVTVEGSYDPLQTSSAAVGNVMERRAISDLPLNGRNPLNLLIVEPGVLQRSQGGDGSGIHVNGSRDRAFNTTIDGIEANESSVPNPLNNIFRLTPDNVQEYRVTTSNPTPEEGRNSGANVSVATRSGTNQLHGTAYEFFRNTALNANEFYSNAFDTPKPDLKMNQYGFDVGGPIRKGKTFFFGSWQGQHINFSQPIDQTFGTPLVYTPEALAGKWRYFRVDPDHPFVLDGLTITRNAPQLVDPHTGALRSGVRTCGSDTDLNCVATYNIFSDDPRHIGGDPVIAKLLSAYPQPNSYAAGDGLNTATYLWNPPNKQRGPHIMGRVDHTFNDYNNLFVRFLYSKHDTLGGDPLNGRPQVFPNFPPEGEVYRRSQNLAISYRRVISSRIVNELTLGYSRFFFNFTQGEANPDFPNIPPFDFANISEPFLNRPRTNRAVTTPQILDNLSIVTGSHVIRTGFNFRFYQHNDQRGQPGGVNVTPTISFSRSIRPPEGFHTPQVANTTRGGITATDNNTLLQGINELLGIPARLTQVFLGDLNSNQFQPFLTGNSVTLWSQGQRLKQYDFFVQDEWKLRRNLTVNYGARWEINLAPTEAGGRVYVPQGSLYDHIDFVHAKRWYQNNNWGAIGPRLGVVWSPGGNDKTVLRAGYGVAFDPISSFMITAVAGKVPGITLSCQANPGGSTTPGCGDAPNLRIAEGFPIQLTPPTTKPDSFLDQPSGQNINQALTLAFFDQNLRLPTVHQWNFNIQRQLPASFVLQAGYLGKRSLRLLRAYDLNQVVADPILPDFLAMQRNVASGCAAAGTGCPAGVTGESIGIVNRGVVSAAFVNSSTTAGELAQNAAGSFAGRIEQTVSAGLRPNSQYSFFTFIDSGGDSYYHAFYTTLRRRLINGLQVELSYTLSKSIDNQSVDPIGAASGGGLSGTNARTPADIRNWRNERGLSDFDRTHSFSAIWLFDLPLGRGPLLSGWSLNGILTASSGEPFSVLSGVNTASFSHVSRADLVGAKPEAKLQSKPSTVGPVYFQDTSAFTYPKPGDVGIGRNVFRGAGYWNLDLGLQKNIPLGERVRMYFRVEAFNALNHPSFETPFSASTGSVRLTSARFGEACCRAVAPLSTQNIIQTGESGRVLQIALKTVF